MTVILQNRNNPECIIRREIIKTRLLRFHCSNGESLLRSQWTIRK